MANPKKNFGYENVESGDNTKFLMHAMTIRKWDKVDLDDPKAVDERCEKYMALCAENDIKPTVSGLANALKISRQTLYDWHAGNHRPAVKNIIDYYYGVLEDLYEEYMMNGKVNPVSGIFMGKNHFGYADKKEITVKAKSKFDELNPDEVREKYIESAVSDDYLLEEHKEDKDD